MDAELVPSQRPVSKAGPKRGKRKGNDGPVVEFDPEARAEYVTGFAKRKAQRRQRALREMVEKERQERLRKEREKRRTRRAALRGKLFAEEEEGQEEQERPKGEGQEVEYEGGVRVTTEHLHNDEGGGERGGDRAKGRTAGATTRRKEREKLDKAFKRLQARTSSSLPKSKGKKGSGGGRRKGKKK